MLLTEVVKEFLNKEPQEKLSSNVPKQNILSDLTQGDLYPNTGSFFDNDSSSSLYGSFDINEVVYKQKDKIMMYRQLANSPDVADAIDEIINEIVFTFDDKIPIKIQINEENEQLVKAISEKFKKIVKLLDIKRSLYRIVKNGYIDGQIILHTAYDKTNTKKGIKSIKIIEPALLYFDNRTKIFKYMDQENNFSSVNRNEAAYSLEEICREDFGLYDGKLNLGYLDYALKPANMLKTLEDLLVPLRFSRSISRRVFNVDIGDLPPKRGAEVMRDYQGKFKYKKFYNTQDGTVTNQQHITSMVEDYWFANRSGGKGTTVDVLDETGNLGELNDILYFNKKLYKAMKVPTNRMSNNPDGDKDFGFDETRTSKEDLKFFMFISRIRQVYSSLFKEVLKREIISTGIMKQSEWDSKEDNISISFSNENNFIEKMKLEAFSSKISLYSEAKELQGSVFSVEKLMSDIFRMSVDDIKIQSDKIREEEKDETFKKYYAEDDGF